MLELDAAWRFSGARMTVVHPLSNKNSMQNPSARTGNVDLAIKIITPFLNNSISQGYLNPLEDLLTTRKRGAKKLINEMTFKIFQEKLYHVSKK